MTADPFKCDAPHCDLPYEACVAWPVLFVCLGHAAAMEAQP